MNTQKAQSILEFTFASIVFIMLASGMTKILHWMYTDLSRRANAHQSCMDSGSISADCGTVAVSSFDASTDVNIKKP